MLKLGAAFLVAVAAFLALLRSGDLDAQERHARAAWGEVLALDRRRAGQIPDLVRAVQALAPRERAVLDAIGAARRRVEATAAGEMTAQDTAGFRAYAQAQGALSAALSSLAVVLERYPETRADAGLSARLALLDRIEGQSVVARRDYVEAAEAVNRALRAVPGRWIAAIARPDAKPFAVFDRAAPDRSPAP